jgi:hypothetical protein
MKKVLTIAAPEGVGEVNGLCSLAAGGNTSYLPMKSAMPILIGFRKQEMES